jgi:transcriptional regulator with XRE-family HTH domain
LRAFFQCDALIGAIDGMVDARHKAELTQEQVAEKLGKRQEVISRWEADTEGRLSFRHHVDLAIACGMVPRVTPVPLKQARCKFQNSMTHPHLEGLWKITGST